MPSVAKQVIAIHVAGVAQLVEHELPKLGVAGSNPVARSRFECGRIQKRPDMKKAG